MIFFEIKDRLILQIAADSPLPTGEKVLTFRAMAKLSAEELVGEESAVQAHADGALAGYGAPQLAAISISRSSQAKRI